MPTVVLRNKVFVPKALIPSEKYLKKHYEHFIYDDRACNKCELLPERHSEVCDTCPAFAGSYKMWSLSKNRKYYMLPLGALGRIRKEFSGQDYKIEDQRVTPSLGIKLKLLSPLYENQIEPTQDFIDAKRGILSAPARSGKTMMGTSAIIKWDYKTIIIAKQVDWLKQFEETILEHTNAKDIIAKGQKVIKICKTYEDFKTHPICLATYQTFISENGQKLLAKIKKLFGTVIVDEVDNAGADHFSQVMSQWHARIRCGVTATWERKDSKHVLVSDIIGPVVAEATIKTLVPTVYVHRTGIKFNSYKIWMYANRAIEKSEPRNNLILKEILKDLRNGHSIVLPVVFQSQIQYWVKKINLAVKKDKLKYDYPDDFPSKKPVALAFWGGQSKTDRDMVRETAKKGECRVTVCMRSMAQRGINVPRWSALYCIMPISNPPNFEQETGRIRTEDKSGKKPPPIIRDFVDEDGLSKGCFRTRWFQTYLASNKKVRCNVSREMMAIGKIALMKAATTKKW